MSDNPQPSAAEIQQWLIARLSKLLKTEPGQIDVTKSFDRLGLDSATAVGITLDLEDFLGRDVDPEVLYENWTVQKLAAYLAAPPDTDSATGGS
jgi:acyl carrier protein